MESRASRVRGREKEEGKHKEKTERKRDDTGRR